MATWDANFEASPDGDDNPGQGDDKIREFKLEVRKRIGNEHGDYVNTAGGADGSQSADWVHKKGSARAYYQSDAPTLRPDGQTSIGTNDAGRVWVSNGGNSPIMVWTGSAWTSTAITFKDTKHNSNLACKILTGGSWNMDTTATNIIQHSLNSTSIRYWRTGIRKDGGNNYVDLGASALASFAHGGYDFTTSDVVVLCRITNGYYDSSLFNSTGFDRARTTIWYRM